MLIDTHTHVVSEDNEEYPLSPGYEASWYHDHPVSADRLFRLMGESEVGRALLVQGYGPYGYDNSYAADAARQRPDVFSSVCVVDYKADPIDKLKYWVIEKGVRGVRLLMPRGQDDVWVDVWKQASSLGSPVTIQIQQRQIPQLIEALHRCPDTAMVLDHSGFPDLSGGYPYTKAAPFFGLAEFEQVHLKVTSINLQQAMEVGSDPRELIKLLAGTFGAERLMWGSDYSQTNNLSYAEFCDLARYASSSLSAREQNWYQLETALKFWPELA